MPDTLHDRLTAALAGKLTEMWQPTVGHSCTGDLPAIKDDARALADVAITALHPTVTDGRLIADLYEEVIRFWFGECYPNVTAPWLLIDGIRGQLGGFVTEELIGREQHIEALENTLARATHFLVGPYRVARRRDKWEVWPDPSLISLTTLDPPETYDDRDTALARARQLAEQ